jgi:hypothetical protein
MAYWAEVAASRVRPLTVEEKTEAWMPDLIPGTVVIDTTGSKVNNESAKSLTVEEKTANWSSDPIPEMISTDTTGSEVNNESKPKRGRKKNTASNQ